MMSDTNTLNPRRIFFLGVNTGFITNGLPDARYFEFYRTRSSAALHCSIIGNIVVPGGFRSNTSTAILSVDPVWSNLAEAISAGGSLPGIQLATVWEGYAGTRRFVGLNPEKVIPMARELVETTGSIGISKILDAFEQGALLSANHGFRHVQFHAAHGYLLSLIVDERINPKAAVSLTRLSTMAKDLGSAGIETSIRISIRTGDPFFDAEGTDCFIDTISTLPFDYVDLSSGFYNIDKRLIYPTRPEIVAARHLESLLVASRHLSQSFIVSGKVMNMDREGLPFNVHFGICRDLIANPNFLENPIEGCHNHNKCHYFSRGEGQISCARWEMGSGA